MPAKPNIRIQAEDFDIKAEIKKLTQGRTDVGAVVTFSGLCRGEGDTLSALELEHYPGMAETEIIRIAEEAIKRFSLLGISCIHRYGKIAPGDNIVLVIATSPHRQASFDGANFLMDFLKTRAPFWKKNHMASGDDGGWVDAKDVDDDALGKWEE